jgi:hypothetical protein
MDSGAASCGSSTLKRRLADPILEANDAEAGIAARNQPILGDCCAEVGRAPVSDDFTRILPGRAEEAVQPARA